ncbi:VOC family protein [Paenibacillus sp. GCM10012306]|uniref:VOC family protein n=1 Tax=Paenibacillus sp. GCM10012306 TaxID=3317342 RepID=UPI00360B640C
MSKLMRVGTIYLPVTNPGLSAKWFCEKLHAELSYIDEGNNHAILNLAHQSFILIQSAQGTLANFQTINDGLMFPLSFEVNGIEALIELHKELSDNGVSVGDIEDRGHSGRNFIITDPDGNKYDVWSELSIEFKEKYNII